MAHRIFFLLVLFYAAPLWAIDDSSMITPEAAQGIKQYAEVYLGNEVMGSGQSGNTVFANVFAWIIFGGVGFIAFMYGKKNSLLKPLLIGILLMVYPYFVHGLWLLYGVGIVLTALLYFLRE